MFGLKLKKLVMVKKRHYRYTKSGPVKKVIGRKNCAKMPWNIPW
jgi:hypothetical protein